MQGGYVRRLPEHKIKPTAVLVSTLVTACWSIGVKCSCNNTNRFVPHLYVSHQMSLFLCFLLIQIWNQQIRKYYSYYREPVVGWPLWGRKVGQKSW
jgi:hypothetical protein